MVRKAMVSGDLMQAVDRSLRALATISVDKSRPRPLVGIAGDLYTKVNEVANNNLFKWLESQGLEVWPSPSQIDLLDCSITSDFIDKLTRLELTGALGAGAVVFKSLISSWRVRRAVGNRVQRFLEPGYLQTLRLARPYMSNKKYELLLVNIAKIVDFIDRGAHGVINAICFNCMVGNASTAIIEKIREDHRTKPIITAVYAGGENPGRQIQLEAFVSQVKDNFRQTEERSNRWL
jgi:predicted nucleotide-binding protein (sugar kinase/HSP70/actin superfamily)